MEQLIHHQKNLKVSCFTILSIAIGIVYLWFGALKFFPHLSPAEDLAKNTMNLLTFGWIPSNVSIILLAIWETALGFLFITNCCRRFAIWAALIHMVCTFSPLFFFPEASFTQNAFTFTLLGQYIVKNLIIIGALWVLYQYDITRKEINKTIHLNNHPS
jgi:uncharacterized membrane protein YkgB